MEPMDQNTLITWLAEAQRGELGWTELAERILRLEHSSGSEHRPDVDRKRRCRFGEVIFGSGKSAEAIGEIAQRLLDGGQMEVLATRVEPDLAERLAALLPFTRYDSAGRTLRISRRAIEVVNLPPYPALSPMPVAVVTAGSTDFPVAQEALETLRWMGVEAELLCDVGVAGPYRLLPHLERLRACAALVVIAGMEGALASVVGGLVPCPVIAVPTSVGYGANLAGVTTLLSMLSSCAAGVTVVNIDAGFKAGYVAGLIATKPPA
jgi:NCAIR mutase (PurE)-related protein